MSFSKPFEQSFPVAEARKRLFQISATDLMEGVLGMSSVFGRLPSEKPGFCDVWAAAAIDGVLYGDFCVDVPNIPEEARFMALQRLLGPVATERPEHQALQKALREGPETLLLAMWGQDADGCAFLVLYHHPSFEESEAKCWLATLLGRGFIRTGSES